jgi:hypothetical protein
MLPLDIDLDGFVLPLTDGLLFVRWRFGFTGPALTTGVLGQNPQRDAAEIVGYLDGCGNVLDLDEDGFVLPLTDGLLFLRYLFGFRDAALITGAVTMPGCMRCTADEIEDYIATLL